VFSAENPGFSTTLLIIILATVVGAVVLVLGITLICYRRRSPLKLNSPARDGKDGQGRGGKKGKKRKKRHGKWLSTSEEESELGELPPPPVIITDPNSLMPEKGILKNSCPKLDTRKGSDGSDSCRQRGSDSGASYIDQESVGTYNYDNEEDDDDEIREIFRINRDSGGSLENLENIPESASFDFVIPPPPPPQYLMQNVFPSPPSGSFPGKMCSPEGGESHPLMWRTALPPQTLSPPQSRIVRLRNFNDLMARFDKTVVDLSPSPDDPPVMQLSPSTCASEDTRNSESEGGGMFCYRGGGGGGASQSDHSPTSVASSSTTNNTAPHSHPYSHPHPHHYAQLYQRPSHNHNHTNLNQYLLKVGRLHFFFLDWK
jgi:hypothetical protein